jgi:hypothetical protein
MYPIKSSRARGGIILVALATLASVISAGPAGASEPATLPEACALHERSPHGARASDPGCDTSAAVRAAETEAAGWPDYDSTAISDPLRNIAVDAAAAEAAGWPDYDSTAISNAERNIAVDAATREAAGWPNYDSTAISAAPSTDIASNSPRMTQIAAEQTTAPVAHHGNPFVL